MRKSTLVVITSITISLIVVIILLSHGSGGAYTIGAILPLTGDGSEYGEEAQQGIDLALYEFNTQGGLAGERVVVVYEDDQGVARNTVAALRKLISVDKVQVVIGAMYSSTALAAAPVAESEQVVLFSPSASTPSYTTAGDYSFRNWPSDVFEGGEMAKFAFTELGLRKVGILTINLDYGIGLANVFSQTFEELGGQIVEQEQYVQGATDFRTQLSKLKYARLDAIYLPGYYSEIGTILIQAQHLDLQTQFLSCVGFDNPITLDIAGEAAEGIIFARPAYDPHSDDTGITLFVNAFRNMYGIDPGTYAAHAYDAASIILHILTLGARSSIEIKEALYHVREFPGVTGPTSFDSNGDVSKPIQLMTVEHGRFIAFEK